MVHKKYIKRDGKTFGPYLYENYRENGVIKTRYLGVGKKEKKIKIPMIILGIILLILIVLSVNFYSSENKFFEFSELKGRLFSESNLNVFLEIKDTNSPEIKIDNEIFVCENNFLNYDFIVNDSDGIEVSLFEMGFVKANPFFLNCDFENLKEEDTILDCKLWSDKLDKSDINDPKNTGAIFQGSWAVYPQEVSADDGEGGTDYEEIEIILIGVNNAPEIENIGVHTIWTKGEQSVFYYKLNVSDKEDCNVENWNCNLPVDELAINLNLLTEEIPQHRLNPHPANITLLIDCRYFRLDKRHKVLPLICWTVLFLFPKVQKLHFARYHLFVQQKPRHLDID